MTRVRWTARLSVSLNEVARNKADELGLSLSNYITLLIMRDTGCLNVEGRQKFLKTLAEKGCL